MERTLAILKPDSVAAGKVGAMIPESQVGGYDGTGEMPYYKHDPAAAKAQLAEAGYPNGIDLGDYIIVAANPLDVACAQILQQQWQAAGITVKLVPMETAPLLSKWATGDWPTLLSVALCVTSLHSLMRPPGTGNMRSSSQLPLSARW